MINNLSDKECDNIVYAANSGCKDALTLVTTRTGIPNGISIIQTRHLQDSNFSLVLTEKLAKNLVDIYTEHQNNEIPFYISGVITIKNNKPTISCHEIIKSTDENNSEQYACQHTDSEMTKACNNALTHSSNTSIPIVFVCHNHPKVENNRKNNLQIINNISTQDLSVTESLHYNATLQNYNGFSATLMINHIGDLNIIIKLRDQYCKITDINFINSDNQLLPISEYTHPSKTNSKLGVFTKPEINYDIPQTKEQKDIIEDLTSFKGFGI